MHNSAQLNTLLEKYPVPVQELALAVRNFLILHITDCIEIPDIQAGIIGYGYGTGYKDTICTLIFSKKQVKIGFYKGAELDDPVKMLEGSGKVHKYVAINTVSQLDENLETLIARALEAYKKRSS